MEVLSFKLITGVELVAEYLGVTGAGYKLRKPLQVHFLRGPDGSEQMAFSHWVLTANPDQDVELLDAVVATKPLKPIQEIAESYVQQTSSIIVPKAAAGQILTS